MAPRDPAAGGGGRLEILTRKYGPLPGYAYLAGAAVAAFVVIRHRSNSSSDPAATGEAGAGEPDTTSSSDGFDGYNDAGTGDPNFNDGGGGGGGGDYPPDLATAGLASQIAAQSSQLTKDATTIANQQHRVTTLQGRVKTLRGQVAPRTRLVTVLKGDNKSKIAARYHTTVRELEKLNPDLRGKNHLVLKPGVKILVPLRQTTPAKAS